ncbi:MAG: site-specific integrase [Thermoplasmata archaeon]
MDAMEASARDQLEKWSEKLGGGRSISSHSIWPRRLVAFCIEMNVKPLDLVRVARQRNDLGQLEALEDVWRAFRKKNSRLKPSSIAFAGKVVQSWLRHCGIEVPRGLFRVPGAGDRHEESALSKEQLHQVIQQANIRERVAIALMAFSGVRPGVLGNFDGSDGLCVKDFPDLLIKDGVASFKQTPAFVVVRGSLNKAGQEYVTLLSEEGCDYVTAYLNSRMNPGADWKKGEKLRPESALLTPDRAKLNHICATNIGDLVRAALRRAGLKDRPYVLRTTWATRWYTAQMEVGVDADVRAFLMGHQGTMSQRYATRPGFRSSPDLLRLMREQYVKVEPYLSTTPTSALSRVIEKERTMWAEKGTTVEDRLAVLEQQLAEVTKENQALRSQQPSPHVSSRASQRLASEAEIPGLLEEGWMVGQKVGDRFAVSAPETPSPN